MRLCSLLLQMCRQLGVAPPKQPVDIQGPTCRVGPAAACQSLSTVVSQPT